MKNRDQPLALADVLAKGQVRRLIRDAERIQALTETVRNALPEALGTHLVAAVMNESTLVLVADSPVWSAQLRFHGPEILTIVSAGQVAGPTRYSVRVAPPAGFAKDR